jgi:hypothetical protein
MAATDASLELLSHFDRPAARRSPLRVPTRGVGWVLQWAASIASVWCALMVLAQFGYGLAAERALSRAARAGALEATLPRATSHTVAQAINRHLPGNLPTRLRFSLHQNGVPIRGRIQAHNDDRLVVTLTAPSQEMLPHWLRIASLWGSDSQISARAERQAPGRHLRDR